MNYSVHSGIAELELISMFSMECPSIECSLALLLALGS